MTILFYKRIVLLRSTNCFSTFGRDLEKLIQREHSLKVGIFCLIIRGNLLLTNKTKLIFNDLHLYKTAKPSGRSTCGYLYFFPKIIENSHSHSLQPMFISLMIQRCILFSAFLPSIKKDISSLINGK